MLLLSIAVALRYEHKALSGVILADRYIVKGQGGWSVSLSGLLGLHPVAQTSVPVVREAFPPGLLAPSDGVLTPQSRDLKYLHFVLCPCFAPGLFVP